MAARRNIDECDGKHHCPGECINTDGSYRCDCDTPGYRPSSVPTVCQDMDECETDNGGCADVCVNKRGSYVCRCEDRGRLLAEDRRSCEDLDECERYKNKICGHGSCSNTDGSYVCTCHDGFLAAKNGSMCADIDECLEENGGCPQGCVNTEGSFTCACHDGYTLDTDNVTCVDIDECEAETQVCSHGCVNSQGSYSCICTQLGYVLTSDNRTCVACSAVQYYDDSQQSCLPCPANSHTVPSHMPLSLAHCICDTGFTGSPANMTDCTDVDECLGQLACSHSCVNVPGSAHCTCPQGFVVDHTGLGCDDVDECDDHDESVNTTCNHTCINIPGSYRCQCQDDGYVLDSDLHTCIDKDECSTGTHNCSHICVNTEGDYRCDCPSGFFLHDDDNQTCHDVNECFMDESPCQQMCNNTPGSYHCGCYSNGFRLSRDLITCVDVNECMEGDNPCPDICINTVGSYTCDCNRQGYRLAEDSSGCLDVDECSNATVHGCDQLCVNLPGTFRCDCREGYRRVGAKGCQACPQGLYRPASSPRCLRCPARSTTNGTARGALHHCFCQRGYTGDPATKKPCQDYDECSIGSFGCQHRCVNTVGSAYCTCNAGFRLSEDKKSCDDVDECSYGKGRCHQMCVNTIGSYSCNCTYPYYTLNRNGYSCDDVNECEMGLLRCSQHDCVNTAGGAYCRCQHGYEVPPNGTLCQDVDECVADNGGCEDECVNTEGSYHCRCSKPGFRLSPDHRQCVDINECLNRSLCKDRCENLDGSYRCHCTQPDTVLAADGHSCEEEDECIKGSHNCSQVCINTSPGYRCDCLPGFYLDGRQCLKCPLGTFREEAMPGTQGCRPCPHHMTTEFPGAMSRTFCICKEGYSIYPLLGRDCRDINECSRRNGGCDGRCHNTVGTFSCSCGPGYTLGDDQKTCHRTSCPTLSPPRHGKLVPVQCQLKPRRRGQRDWLTPGTICSHRCKRGYWLRGQTYRQCQHNGTWSSQPPVCVAKTCSGLTPPVNGYLLPPVCNTGPIPFRKRCKFRCNRNFRLKGKWGARCLANQRWSSDGSATKCIPKSNNETKDRKKTAGDKRKGRS